MFTIFELFAAMWTTSGEEGLSMNSSPPTTPEHPARPATQRTPALAAWEQLGYGMFIHFGISTFIGNEMPTFKTNAADFRPSALDVDQWLRVARDAGMRYAVLTTKHCAGHCLWPSALTNHTVKSSPVQIDVVRQFVEACRRYGISPGLYYLLGWDSYHQPRMSPQQYETFCQGQLTELLTGYGPIQQVFVDVPDDVGPDMKGVLSRHYAHIKRLQPGCLVLPNQAFFDGSQVVSKPPTWQRQTLNLAPMPVWPRDIMNGEKTLPPLLGHDPRIHFEGREYYLPMEVCDTLEEHWFWMPGDSPRPLETLVQLYRSCAERRANLLLNVGPDRTGKIPDASARRLMELRDAVKAP
jgi:alpha-L-fucosidase